MSRSRQFFGCHTIALLDEELKQWCCISHGSSLLADNQWVLRYDSKPGHILLGELEDDRVLQVYVEQFVSDDCATPTVHLVKLSFVQMAARTKMMIKLQVYKHRLLQFFS